MRGKIIRLPVCFAGSRPAMIMLALALPSIAVVSFDHRCATPIPHVVTGRPGSSSHRSYSKQASNARRQQTASIEIPIASDAPPRHTSRGFLLWRFAYAGPRCPPRHHHGAGIRKPSQKRPSPPARVLSDRKFALRPAPPSRDQLVWATFKSRLRTANLGCDRTSRIFAECPNLSTN